MEKRSVLPRSLRRRGVIPGVPRLESNRPLRLTDEYIYRLNRCI